MPKKKEVVEKTKKVVKEEVEAAKSELETEVKADELKEAKVEEPKKEEVLSHFFADWLLKKHGSDPVRFKRIEDLMRDCIKDVTTPYKDGPAPFLKWLRENRYKKIYTIKELKALEYKYLGLNP